MGVLKGKMSRGSCPHNYKVGSRRKLFRGAKSGTPKHCKGRTWGNPGKKEEYQSSGKCNGGYYKKKSRSHKEGQH